MPPVPPVPPAPIVPVPAVITPVVPVVAVEEEEEEEELTVIEDPAPPLTVPEPELPTEPEPEEEDDEVVVIEIIDEATPLAAPTEIRGSWALWNLILSIAGAILALMMGIRVLMKKRQEKENEDGRAAAKASTDDDESEEKKRGRLLLTLAIPFLAIVGIILFILTQDMRLPMIMIDWWTLAHAILFIGGIVSYIFAYKKEKDEDDDDNTQPAGHTSAA